MRPGPVRRNRPDGSVAVTRRLRPRRASHLGRRLDAGKRRGGDPHRQALWRGCCQRGRIEPRAEGSRESTAVRRGGARSVTVSESLAYFRTFSAYGSWLHGDERGSVDRTLAAPLSLLRRAAFHAPDHRDLVAAVVVAH